MKYLIIFFLSSIPCTIFSQTESDSVEYTHIYLTDSTKIEKKYKEPKYYSIPFAPVTYFSIKIPQTTYFSLTLCSMEDSKKIKIEKVIFVGYLAEGNFRIEDMNLHKEFQGLYYYQVDVLDSVHYERVFLMK